MGNRYVGMFLEGGIEERNGICGSNRRRNNADETLLQCKHLEFVHSLHY